MSRSLWPLMLIPAVAVLSACAEPARSTTAPTATIGPPAATPGAGPGATAITLGQTVARLITATDPPCGIHILPLAPEPCQQFAVTIDRHGRLRVRVTSPDPDELTLRVGTAFYWGRTLDVSASVASAATYEISVGLHGGRGSQAFELIATFEPF